MDRILVSARHAVAQVLIPIFSVATCCAVLAVPLAGSGQVVTPKTLPVLQGGQFDMLPSDRAGMGGVTIAVDDTLLDPFVNPAKATRMGASRIFSAPFFHSISGSRGGGRSLPLGGAGSWGDWAATGVFTFQQLDRIPPTLFFFPCPACAQSGQASQSSTSGRSAYNQYVTGSLARRLTPSTSVGLSLQLADIQAIDGVDLLYAGSDRIDQSGSLADFRFGVTKELGADRHLEVLLVHARTDITHDVRFTTFRYDPVTRNYTQLQRTDHNQDQTHIWGLHSEYSRPVGSDGWHVGWLGTANHLSHPKIPNYAIQNIPRDPGTTYSFNAGVGIGRSVRGASFAADLIYEPMFANTWATAANDTAVVGCSQVCLASAGTIKAGEKTVENNFHFNNVRLRFGGGDEFAIRREGSTAIGYQVGLDLYAIKYRLQQDNHVLVSSRTQNENWLEWSPTFALSLRSRGLDVRYNFSMTCGPGACGQTQDFPVIAFSPAADNLAGGIIAAPSGELFMQSGALKIHKLTIIVPIH